MLYQPKMKTLKLKYLQNKKLEFRCVYYIKLNILNKENLKKIQQKIKTKKVIIVNSKSTSIKIKKKKLFNLNSKISIIKKKLSKLIKLNNLDKIKIIQPKKIQFKILEKILLKEGILFNNSNIKNPSKIKIDFMRNLILNKKGKLFYLYINKKLEAYFFVILNKDIVNFYDINFRSPLNGYLANHLVAFAIKKLKLKERKVVTSIHHKNVKAIKFFQSLGFKIINTFFLQLFFKK